MRSLCVEEVNPFGELELFVDAICELLHLTPIFCLNLSLVVFGSTRKREVNLTLTLNSIKHINFTSCCVLACLLNIMKFHFHNLYPYVNCVFMTKYLTCIEASDKMLPLVCTLFSNLFYQKFFQESYRSVKQVGSRS